jgi:hypothetical protein
MFSTTVANSNRTDSISNLPASILEKSKMSLMMFSNALAEYSILFR